MSGKEERETTTVSETTKKVEKFLKESFGNAFKKARGKPIFMGRSGSTIVYISIIEWDSDTLVNVFAFVVSGATVTPELMEFLLEENHVLRFGAFSLDGEGNIIFRHSLVGSTLDKKELESAVYAVALTADEYDDIIAKEFGGLRAIDQVELMDETEDLDWGDSES